MQLATINQAQTMSSLEIANLTGKRHSDVLRDIENIFKQAEIDSTHYCAQYKDASGKTNPLYNLPRRECDLVVSGYSVKYRLAIIDRWQELEAKQQPQIPQTYAAALLEAGRLALIVEEQSAKITADAPKVAFAEAVRAMEGACEVGALAKALDTGRNKLFKWMRDKKYLMVTNYPYQQYIDRGLFVVIEQTPYTDRDGKAQPSFKTLVTGKGQVWLESKFRESEQ